MSAVKGKETVPELTVRRLLRRLGLRPGVQAADLPGRPDFVFRRRRTVVFVHGCFWHQHSCAAGARIPKTRRSFWEKKLQTNQARDIRVKRALTRLGWRYVIIWECELREAERVTGKLARFLDVTDAIS